MNASIGVLQEMKFVANRWTPWVIIVALAELGLVYRRGTLDWQTM